MELVESVGNEYRNYVWETNALNRLADDIEMLRHCHATIEEGHRYYITTVQERELIGIPDRTMKYDDVSKWGSAQKKAFEIMEALDFKRVSCVPLLYRNFWLLDGSMRILEDNGIRTDMFNSIYNNNNRHKRDATIAEAAMYHGCTLISNDGRLRNKVNCFFPSSAISFEEYKNIVSMLRDKGGNQ